MDTSLLGPDGPVNKLLAAAGDLLWAYLPIAALVATGLYFTIRTRFVQLRMVGEMFRLLVDSPGKSAGGKSISSFQAFAVSVATHGMQPRGNPAAWQTGFQAARRLPSAEKAGNKRPRFPRKPNARHPAEARRMARRGRGGLTDKFYQKRISLSRLAYKSDFLSIFASSQTRRSALNGQEHIINLSI